MSVFRFVWGDTVRIIPAAPAEFRPGLLASVCGIRPAPGAGEQSASSSAEVLDDQDLYLVEFGDGVALEIPGQFLEGVEQS